MPLRAFHNGSWRNISAFYAFHNGAWRAITKYWAYHNGAWRAIITTASPAPPPAPAPAPQPPPPAVSVTQVNADQDDGSCTYQQDAKGALRTCAAFSDWTANAGTGATYVWSLPTNTGGFSIIGSTTDQTVKLVTNGAAGSRHCTLRCLATIGGATTSTDTAVTHVHISE